MRNVAASLAFLAVLVLAAAVVPIEGRLTFLAGAGAVALGLLAAFLVLLGDQAARQRRAGPKRDGMEVL